MDASFISTYKIDLSPKSKYYDNEFNPSTEKAKLDPLETITLPLYLNSEIRDGPIIGQTWISAPMPTGTMPTDPDVKKNRCCLMLYVEIFKKRKNAIAELNLNIKNKLDNINILIIN